MKNKIKKLKFPKNPETLIDKKEVETYLYYLEDNGELDKLPLPFLTYYIVGNILTNEVNNDGFSQYLSNSSVNTLPYLKKCVDEINNEKLTSIIDDLLSAIQNYLKTDDIETIKNSDYSDDLEEILSSLDDRFYSLDEKLDVETLAKKYYQTNIPEDKLVIEIVKERESEYVHYFTKNVTSVTNEEAIKAFMDFLTLYPNINFDIQIERWDGFYRLRAIDNSNSFNLAEIMNKFKDDSKSDHLCKMLGFKFFGSIFQGVYFEACDENKNLWRMDIEKSGFKKNEYKIRRYLYSSYYANPEYLYNHKILSDVSIGDFNYDDVDVELMKQILVKRANQLDNINRIYEEIIEFNPTIKTIINTIYLK